MKNKKPKGNKLISDVKNRSAWNYYSDGFKYVRIYEVYSINPPSCGEIGK